tara:strand:+ start:95 stop:325 length:231 start_codon:yes stop_codon:yes gene_type:complete
MDSATDYQALEEAAFKQYCDADRILGSDMTQETRDSMLDAVMKIMGDRDDEYVRLFNLRRNARVAEAEMVSNIDLL